MHANKHLITDVLKGELHFEGFVVSDWEAIATLPGSNASRIEAAINAGVDMAMVPLSYPSFVSGLRSLVKKGRVPWRALTMPFDASEAEGASQAVGAPVPEFAGQLGSFEHERWRAKRFDKVRFCSRTRTACCAVQERSHPCGGQQV